MGKIGLVGVLVALAMGAGAELCAQSHPASATQPAAWLLRGPYVQWDSATSRRILVKPAKGAAKLKVRYGPAEAKADGGSLVTMEGDPRSGIFRAVLKNLQPGREYRYRVEAGGQVGDWSPFLMPPGAQSKQPLRFAVYGDSHENVKVHVPLSRAMAREPGLAFVCHVGDLVGKANEASYDRGFFTQARPLLRRAMLLPVVGNHDTYGPDKGDLLPRLFDLPAPGRRYWSVDLGPVHLVGLDCFDPARRGNPFSPDAKQGQWLRKDLAAAKEQTWKVVLLHEPPLSAGRRGLAKRRRLIEDLCEALEGFGVDICFAGDQHMYNRTHPVGSEGKPSPVYVTTGGGGGYSSRLVSGDPKLPPNLRGGDSFHAMMRYIYHYCLVEVSGQTMTVTAKTIKGQPADRFTITKGRAPKKTFSREAALKEIEARATKP